MAIENGNRIGVDDEKYELNGFVRKDENGALEIDIDAVNEVARKYLFVK